MQFSYVSIVPRKFSAFLEDLSAVFVLSLDAAFWQRGLNVLDFLQSSLFAPFLVFVSVTLFVSRKSGVQY
jgi:hypothetical protein